MCRSVAPHASRLETPCSYSSPSSTRSFLPFVILANVCSTFMVGVEKGPKEKALLYSGTGNWFHAEVGDGSNSAEDKA